MDTPHNTPGATPNGQVNPRLLSTIGSAAVGSRHSVESLMEYIKKQKLIIKKKQAEIDGLVASRVAEANDCQNIEGSSSSSACISEKVVLFGERIKSVMGKKYDLRDAFSKWTRAVLYGLKKDANTQSLALAASEKRVMKLKALLARTHSANQKNIEDSNALKREQQMSLEELKQLKAREESELKYLQEVQRASSLETAFQYDTDRQIQEAVANFIASRPEGILVEAVNPQMEATPTDASPKNSSTSVTNETNLRSEIRQLTERLEAQTAQHREELDVKEAARAELDARVKELGARNKSLEEAMTGVQNTLKSENTLRRELELELDELIVDRSRMVQEGRVTAGIKDRVKELESNLNKARADLDKLEKEKGAILEEVKVLRKGHTDISNVEAENVRLHAIVKDFTRRGSFLPKNRSKSTARHKNQISSAGAKIPLVPVEGGDQTVDQLVDAIKLVLATDACLLDAGAHKSIIEIEDEVSILRCCLIGLGEKVDSSRYFKYLGDDNLTPLCVGNRVRNAQQDVTSRIEGLEEQVALSEARIASAATKMGSLTTGSVSLEDDIFMKESLEHQLKLARQDLAELNAYESERKDLCARVRYRMASLEILKRQIKRGGDGGSRSMLRTILQKFGRGDEDLGQGDAVGDAVAKPADTAIYTAEDVTVKAADDLKIPISSNSGVKLSWNIQVKGPGDIGLAILWQRDDSSLEVVRQYDRSAHSSGDIWLPNHTGTTATWYVFMDNSFSWVRQKQLSYKIVVEKTSFDDRLDGDGDDGGDGQDPDQQNLNAGSTLDVYKQTTSFLARMALEI